MAMGDGQGLIGGSRGPHRPPPCPNVPHIVTATVVLVTLASQVISLRPHYGSSGCPLSGRVSGLLDRLWCLLHCSSMSRRILLRPSYDAHTVRFSHANRTLSLYYVSCGAHMTRSGLCSWRLRRHPDSQDGRREGGRGQ